MSAIKSLLCIDAGNSMVKWCLHANSTQPFTLASDLKSQPTTVFKPFDCALPMVLKHLGATVNESGHTIEAVLLCNVLGPDFEAAVQGLCEQHKLPLHVLAVNSRAQVQSAYENPASLGKDRWAACLAVSQISQAKANLLVSFGTATTLDAVVNTGAWHHLGGFIVPGVQTMLDSLHTKTAELPKVELSQPDAVQMWPLGTRQAISEGVARTQTALIQSLLAELNVQHSQQPALWLSGGFASAMIALLPGAQLLEHAVFKGLVFDYQLTRQGLA
jgi:type III pantothenate kinase